ncbi:MAG: hypothetical protein U0931_37280 [Vulcanimicrobiota bacterium]
MEIMLALGLLALVVIGVMVVLTGGLSMLNQSADIAQARQLAALELERIRIGDFAYNPDGSYFDGRINTPQRNGFPPAPYPMAEGKYQLAVAVQRVSPALRSIQVTVYWGRNHRLQLETMVNP